ncbi:uncharacterized protein LAESUDRAFT_718615 [Laetiporus sulphureus 93-53]|uniref:Uncharacterized protein n=1 Tax=Laetiporus sulphureus 93-53 TaxID=1314785 RepID=A0A165ARX5_9APHY|nr:uncharacterized protein LAESUDRAFT_718615 [Laetiporus sulphureus 93-53]KZS99541.1 hypothetical protein LAESUDRAFT_718615 [Laetiporus sulphureus 93-53]
MQNCTARNGHRIAPQRDRRLVTNESQLGKRASLIFIDSSEIIYTRRYDAAVHTKLRDQEGQGTSQFLDAQRIHNLYLQGLHSLGRANADHTILLLNTYTKLKDVARLDSFIKRKSSCATDELPFDLDNSIRVCRQDISSMLRLGNYKDALVYLGRFGAEAVGRSKSGSLWPSYADNLPELLIDFCASLAPSPFEDEGEIKGPTRQARGGGPSSFSYIVLDKSSTPAPAMPTDGAAPSSAPSMTARPGGRARRDSVQDVSRTATSSPATLTNPSLTKARGQTVDPSAPHAVVENDPNADEEAEKWDQIAVEYPAGAFPHPGWRITGADWLADAQQGYARLAERQYLTHALVLCSTRSFTQGLILLWERSRMYEGILRFWMGAYRAKTHPDAPAEVVRALNKYGDGKPRLNPLMLKFLTSTPQLLSRHAEDLQNILRVVDEQGIMQPLSVVQVLSRNGVTSVGLVRQWLMTRVRQAQQEVETDQQVIDSYFNETREKLRQVEDLSDPDQPKEEYHVAHVVFQLVDLDQCCGLLPFRLLCMREFNLYNGVVFQSHREHIGRYCE